jgi:hypothetical protein
MNGLRTVKAVAHVHSSWSYDARWELTALAASFRRRGCSVLMTTEHDRGFSAERLAAYRDACASVSNSDFLVLPGIEYSDPGNKIHVLVWGGLPFLGEGLPTGELLRRVNEHAGFAVLAHPWRRDAWWDFDEAWLSQLYGIEVWNRRYNGVAPDPRVAAVVKNWGLVPFVSLDFHESRQFFPLRMRLSVEGDLEEGQVLEALRARRCAPISLGIDPLLLTTGIGSDVSNLAERFRKAALRTVRRTRRWYGQRR